jgi:hypothetical protein
MDHNNKEHVSDKAGRQIHREGVEAGQKAVRELTQKLVERGFDAVEVGKHVREGIEEGARAL